MSQATESAIARHGDAIADKRNVHGMATGTKITNGIDTGIECITVFVTRKEDFSALALDDLIPSSVDGVLTDVVVMRSFSVPDPVPLAQTQVLTEHIGGASIGNYRITAGTWGVVVFDCDTGEPYVLSNWHVLVGHAGLLGDYILCPGSFDGGTIANNTIGDLVRYEPLYMLGEFPPAEPEPVPVPEPSGCLPLAAIARHFAPSVMHTTISSEPFHNRIDAALARFFPGVQWQPGIKDIGEVKGVNDNPVAGLGVRKMGRTTGLTNGTVVYTDALIDVGYGGGKTARFSGQIIIAGSSGAFSAGGDSGSVIVDGLSQAVALLFAGNGETTIANPIAPVMEALNVGF